MSYVVHIGMCGDGYTSLKYYIICMIHSCDKFVLETVINPFNILMPVKLYKFIKLTAIIKYKYFTLFNII